MVMVYVPGGTFQMGSNDGDSNEQPVHEVTLYSFWIDRTEVTNAQYARCVEDGKCSTPSDLSSYARDSYYVDYPVIYVSWDDANDYCTWADAQLPTEAQWEYAARGSEGRKYPWGNEQPNAQLLNYNANLGDTSKGGSYPDGASWVGALDMAGNVWEWVADWYGKYSSEPQENPTGPSAGVTRVLRGGGWYGPEYLVRAASRYSVTPVSRLDLLGFRCVSTVPGE